MQYKETSFLLFFNYSDSDFHKMDGSEMRLLVVVDVDYSGEKVFLFFFLDLNNYIFRLMFEYMAEVIKSIKI